MVGRILGLDVGTKTVGVAVSDPLGYTAQGVGVIRYRGAGQAIEEIRGLVDLYNAERLVVGYPLSLKGEPGPQAQAVQAFVDKLKALGLPIELVDERLTTKQAEQVLIAGGLRREKRREIIDQQAAILILQGYLDRRSRNP